MASYIIYKCFNVVFPPLSACSQQQVDVITATFPQVNLTWILHEFDSSKGILSLGSEIFVSYYYKK